MGKSEDLYYWKKFNVTKQEFDEIWNQVKKDNLPSISGDFPYEDVWDENRTYVNKFILEKLKPYIRNKRINDILE